MFYRRMSSTRSVVMMFGFKGFVSTTLFILNPIFVLLHFQLLSSQVLTLISLSSFKKCDEMKAVSQNQFSVTAQSLLVVEHDSQAVPAFLVKMTLRGITPEAELIDKLQTCLIETI